MSFDAQNFIARFVPDMVVERLATGGAIRAQELSTHHAVVGFFDVAGFSSLARDLELADKEHSSKMLRKKSISLTMAANQQGKGAEELVRQLNETLGALIETIRQAGGDVIKFAGDAILVVWLCDESTQASALVRACKCSLVCKGLKRDSSSLGLHVGIGIGQLVAAHVGGTFGRWEFFIAGDACTQSALSEGLAGVDEVVVSPKSRLVLEALVKSGDVLSIDGNLIAAKDEHHQPSSSSSSSFGVAGSTEEAAEQALMLRDLVLPPASSLLVTPPRSEKAWLHDPVTAKAAEGYVPGPVRDALKSGGSSSSVGGLRKLTVIFFKLYDVVLPPVFNETTKQEFLEQAQKQAKLVQESAYHYYATLRQFILDDKGFVAIVALGLPPFFHEDNAVRAIKVASRLIGHNKVRAAAGICTGTVFCGVVGSETRAEYSVAGSCINLAARLMSKAGPGNILVDQATKLEAEASSGMMFEQHPSLTLKGFEKPVECFAPQLGQQFAADDAAGKHGSIRRQSRRLATNSGGPSANSQQATGVVGMHAEQAALRHASFVAAPPLHAVLLEGDAGSGKTHLVQNAIVETTAKHVFISTADASEMSTPFFVWRSVLQDMLSIARPRDPQSSKEPLLPGAAPAQGHKRSQSASLATSGNGGGGGSRSGSSPQPPEAKRAAGPSTIAAHTSFDSSVLETDRTSILMGSENVARTRAGSDMASRRSRGDSNHSGGSTDVPRSRLEVVSSARERSGSDLTQSRSRADSALVSSGGAGGTESPQGQSKKRQFADRLRAGGGGVGRTLRGLSTSLIPGGGKSTNATGSGKEDDLQLPSPGVLSASPPPVLTARAGSSTNLNSNPMDVTFHPDNSLLLERMRDMGRLQGRRLSVLHSIMPNLLVPSELGAAPPGPTASGSEYSTPEVENRSDMKRRASQFSLLLPQTPVLSPSPASEKPPVADFVSDSQAAIDLMLMMLEELGNLGDTLVVLENAHNMDKNSWELLKKAIDFSPASWKSDYKVRFIVTFRPFSPPSSHVLNHILGNTRPERVSVVASASPMFHTVSTLSTLALDRVSSVGAGRRRSVGGGSAPGGGGGGGGGGGNTSGELAPTPSHQGSGSSAFADGPAKDVQHVIISNLTQRDAGVFLSNVHHVVLGVKVLNFLYRKSLGNPRALLECYKVLEDQGVIKVDPNAGTVEETTSLEAIADLVFVIPVHVRAQLLQRFDQLGTREQLLLKLASVIGLTAQRSVLLALFEQRYVSLRPPSPTSVTLDGKSASDSLDEGLELLRKQGFLKPFLRKAKADLDDDEDWVFENAQVKFLVYNQMLHNDRKAVHGAVLHWYETHPSVRRDDPAFLGNHAMGAERIDVAFRCFKEGLLRTILKGEPVHKALGLWHACADILDDVDAKHGFSEARVLAERTSIDVLMGQLYVEKEEWEEAKQHLARALQLARMPSEQRPRSGSRFWLLRGCWPDRNTASSSSAALTAVRMGLRDPLRAPEKETNPEADLKRSGELAVQLMQRIQAMQWAAAQHVERIKRFSRNAMVCE